MKQVLIYSLIHMQMDSWLENNIFKNAFCAFNSGSF